MALEIGSDVAKTLPSSVKNALGQMTGEQQAVFEEEYKKKMKSPLLMQLLAIFFPIHYFLLGRIGTGLIFLFTIGGVYVWWLIDIFRIRGVVDAHNEDAAKALLRDMKIMGS
ncbi:MAG: TM2 domain-containing protein [Sideroxydans sp.]|nr:TM2 domain-containing protein [Sideroxydans sp.]